MRLTANKPCTFGGERFLIGDTIPAELVDNPKEQEKRGVLTIGNDGEVAPVNTGAATFEIIVHSDGGDIPLKLTNAELMVFTDILQIPVSNAESKQKISDMIQTINSEDLLIALDALDGRKHVKEEVKARIVEFDAMESGGE